MLKMKAQLRLSCFGIKLKHYLQAAAGTKENTENNTTKPCIKRGRAFIQSHSQSQMLERKPKFG